MSKLIPEHRDYLAAHAVDPELATSLGVRSLTGRPDVATLGEPWQNWANFPALLFPWTGPDGRTEYQVRPDNPTEDRSGRPRKYVFRSGMVPVLWAVRPVEGAEKALIVEGTKQCLAAASYAPPGVAVFGVAGCRGWMHEGAPIPDLTVVGDLAVTVVFDVDAGGNLDVYTAGEGLAEACALFGAAKVSFARLPGTGKADLDGILGKLPEPARAGFVACSPRRRG